MCVKLHLRGCVPSLGTAQSMCWPRKSLGHMLLFFHQLSASRDNLGNFLSKLQFVKSFFNFGNSHPWWEINLYGRKMLECCTESSLSPNPLPYQQWKFLFSVLIALFIFFRVNILHTEKCIKHKCSAQWFLTEWRHKISQYQDKKILLAPQKITPTLAPPTLLTP